jgi:hypothetical protein
MIALSSNNLPLNLEALINETINYKSTAMHLFGIWFKIGESSLEIDHNFYFFKFEENYLFLNNIQPILLTFGLLGLINFFVRSFVNLCKDHPLGWIYQFSYNINIHMGRSFFFKALIAVQPIVLYLVLVDLYHVKSWLNVARIFSALFGVAALAGYVLLVVKMASESAKLFSLFDPRMRADLKSYRESNANLGKFTKSYSF